MYGGRRLRHQSHHQGPPRRLGPQVPHQVGSLTLVALHVWFVVVVTQPSMTVLGHLGRYEAACGETSAREGAGRATIGGAASRGTVVATTVACCGAGSTNGGRWGGRDTHGTRAGMVAIACCL